MFDLVFRVSGHLIWYLWDKRSYLHWAWLPKYWLVTSRTCKKCLFLISRAIWWARWGVGGGGGVGLWGWWGEAHRRIRLPKIYGIHWVFVWIWILIRQCLYPCYLNFSWKRFEFMFLLCILQSVCFCSLVALAKNTVVYLWYVFLKGSPLADMEK